MNLQHRLNSLNEQKRSYTRGTVEYINDQWVFFDEENDEASLLEELSEFEMEVLTLNKWERGSYVGDGLIKLIDYLYKLDQGDNIRVRKGLQYSYRVLLESLPDEIFIQYTSTLNKLSFSLYDCIYCHNYSMFIENVEQNIHGVNTIIYDNNELICTVQHHFSRGNKSQDRFEYTIANGKRSVLTSLGG
ncbi:DUF2777 domain-containing protein [Bacillus timonensis]|nr:DUF2777 domain-containing protein [Bacillus timonensis]